MMRKLLWRGGGGLATVVSVVLFLYAPSWAGDGECSGCMVLGELSVMLSDIQPPEPEVGDEVTFTFSVASRLPFPPRPTPPSPPSTSPWQANMKSWSRSSAKTILRPLPPANRGPSRSRPASRA